MDAFQIQNNPEYSTVPAQPSPMEIDPPLPMQTSNHLTSDGLDIGHGGGGKESTSDSVGNEKKRKCPDTSSNEPTPKSSRCSDNIDQNGTGDFSNDDYEEEEEENGGINGDMMDISSRPPLEFDILDELETGGAEEASSGSQSDTDSDIPEAEIEAMLEEGLKSYTKGSGPADSSRDGELAHEVKQKVLLKVRGRDHFDVLPEGWIELTHNSGMPVYLHKQTRVCSFSRPYFLGPGSARKHEVPISSIPCLHYKKMLEKENSQNQEKELCKEKASGEEKLNDKEDPSIQNSPEKKQLEQVTLLEKDVLSRIEIVPEKDASFSTDLVPEKHSSTEKRESSKKDISKKDTSEIAVLPGKETVHKKEVLPKNKISSEKDVSPEKGAPSKRKTMTMEDVVFEKEVQSNIVLKKKIVPEKGVLHEVEDPIKGCGRKTDENIEKTVVGPDGTIPIPAAKVESMQESKKEGSLDYLTLREYCQNLFEFQTLTVRRFKTWSARRKHHKMKQRPTLPDETVLITCLLPNANNKGRSSGNISTKEFLMNPSGKSFVCVLHEYVQHTMRLQPRYIFKELESPSTPYGATVVINDMKYGSGFGGSKKQAKLAAAKSTLEILIPQMKEVIKEGRKSESLFQDVSFFDEVRVTDPRVNELCVKVGQPQPYQLLLECLRRNYGMGDTEIKMEMKNVKHQKNEFIMKVGKHTARVLCKNKRDGKQSASQSILQSLHPHINSWGSLLRLYGKGSFYTLKEKKEEEQKITELQSKACANKPNISILNKLKEEMLKLKERKESIKPIGKFIPEEMELPSTSSSNLKNVEL